MKPKKLTEQEVAVQLIAVGVRLQKPSRDEFQVRLTGSKPGDGYFTTDLQDALDTGRAMAKDNPQADRYGWVRYPLAPNAVGNLVEDLALIQRLIGSALYESKQIDGVLFIRRA